MEDALGGMSDREDKVFYGAKEHVNDENDQQVGSDEDNHDSICDDENDQQIWISVWSDEDNDESIYDEMAEMYSQASNRLPEANYKILNQKDIQQRQEEVISGITSILSVSRPDAIILLEHFNWSISTVEDEWFADEDGVRKSVGLVQFGLEWFADEDGVRKSVGLVQFGLEQEEVRGFVPKEMTCGICFEQHYVELMKSTPACRHFFCDTCWTAYIHTAIEDGPGCLTRRCAEPSCRAATREDMVLSLVSQEDGAKYTRYRLRGFVENSGATTWCPAPGCEYAVEYGPRVGSLDIVCKCSHMFCSDCLNEAHQPADCQTVAKWLLKYGSESENLNWILVNSKACPKCQRPIEKNEGCIHMTCNPPCRFEFCWLCLGPWTSQDPHLRCNGFVRTMEEGRNDEAERKREMAKKSLDRYTHYYERWAANESARAKALAVLQQMEEKLSDKKSELESRKYSLPEALRQIGEFRRVLKWTYVYGYYIPEQDPIKLELFENRVGKAEAHLEKLSQVAEKELQKFVYREFKFQRLPCQTSFNEFRAKLVEPTTTARSYFTNFLRDLKNGFRKVHMD